jgi:hypothetical protein
MRLVWLAALSRPSCYGVDIFCIVLQVVKDNELGALVGNVDGMYIELHRQFLHYVIILVFALMVKHCV